MFSKLRFPKAPEIGYGAFYAYGFLALPLAAAFLSLQVFIPTYYADALGLSLTAVGAILLAARLWDMVSDPLVGFLSDRTPARLGRRRIWIIAGMPLVLLSVWNLFVPGENVSNLSLLIWSVIIYSAGTMMIVPMNAWGAELAHDYDERSRITGVRVTFGLIGALAALLLPAALGFTDAREVGAGLEANALFIIGAIALGVLGVVLLVPDRGSTTGANKVQLKDYVGVLRQKGPVRHLVGCYFLNSIANALPATLFLLFVTHVLQAPDNAGLWLVGYFAVSALAVPFWVMASRWWGKDRTWRIAMLSTCAFFVWVPFLGEGDATLFLIILLGSGFALGADLVLPGALQADAVDWDELNNGKRRPGILFALLGTATKLSYALAVGLAFPLLDWVGFSTEGGNSSQQLMVLAVLYGVLPVLLKLAALWLMRSYPLTREAHEEVQLKLNPQPAE